MPTVSIYNQKGEKVGEQDLDPKAFDLKVKSAVVHQALLAQLANARHSVAHTKTRGEVSGGGKKPWKQKGTGRARHGSIRSPIWKGGGTVFGPRAARDFSQKINRKVRASAILMCVSDKAAHAKLVVLDNLNLADGKTKTVSKLLSVLPVKDKKTLVGLEKSNKNFMSGVKNLENVWAEDAGSLNVRDLLKYEYLLTTPEGLKKIASTFGK